MTSSVRPVRKVLSAAGIALGFLVALAAGLEYRVIASTHHVSLSSQGISPTTLSVAGGSKVKIRIKNTDTKSHNFVIPDFSIFTSNLAPGQEASVEFEPDKTGRFPYYSDYSEQGVYGKPEPGYLGTLFVK